MDGSPEAAATGYPVAAPEAQDNGQTRLNDGRVEDWVYGGEFYGHDSSPKK